MSSCVTQNSWRHFWLFDGLDCLAKPEIIPPTLTWRALTPNKLWIKKSRQFQLRSPFLWIKPYDGWSHVLVRTVSQVTLLSASIHSGHGESPGGSSLPRLAKLRRKVSRVLDTYLYALITGTAGFVHQDWKTSELCPAVFWTCKIWLIIAAVADSMLFGVVTVDSDQRSTKDGFSRRRCLIPDGIWAVSFHQDVRMYPPIQLAVAMEGKQNIYSL